MAPRRCFSALVINYFVLKGSPLYVHLLRPYENLRKTETFSLEISLYPIHL